MKTQNNIRKIASGQEDDYTAGCLQDYPYFKEHYELISIDLSKQQVLDADPKAIQQMNFTGNLNHPNNQGQNINDNTASFSLLKKQKNRFRFFTRNCKSIVNLFYFNIILV